MGRFENILDHPVMSATLQHFRQIRFTRQMTEEKARNTHDDVSGIFSLLLWGASTSRSSAPLCAHTHTLCLCASVSAIHGSETQRFGSSHILDIPRCVTKS